LQLPPDTFLHARGLLFDMDGTLVDSAAAVARAWGQFAQRHRLDPEEVLVQCQGRQAGETIAAYARAGVDLDVAGETAMMLAAEVADVEGVVAVPGAAALLAALPPDAWALVTSAFRPLAERRMAAAGLPLPAHLITGELVARGKPAPDGFLAGARALGLAPGDCLAFEDAPAGLVAAHRSGCGVLAVGTTLAPRDLDGERWIPDFTGLQFQGCSGGRLSLVVTG